MIHRLRDGGYAYGTKDQSPALAAGAVGNILEWYDFAIYGFLAPVLAVLFFPSDDPVVSLIAAFGVFAAGYLMRPVGSLILGHVGDRMGRKPALTLSIALMAIPTGLMTVLPTHASLGVGAGMPLKRRRPASLAA